MLRLLKYRLTKMNANELNSKIKNGMVILIDTNEKEIGHITSYYDRNNVKYRRQNIDAGDYSFEFEGVSFVNHYVVERKNSLEELSVNLGRYRDRFENELERKGGVLEILVESDGWHDVHSGNYKEHYSEKRKKMTKLDKNSFMATLMTYKFRYGVETNFCNKEYIAKHIYCTFHYMVREMLKKETKERKIL
jgi:hypothetical protein